MSHTDEESCAHRFVPTRIRGGRTVDRCVHCKAEVPCAPCRAAAWERARCKHVDCACELDARPPQGTAYTTIDGARTESK